MCKFCDTFNRIYKIPIRNRYSDDNCCEFVSSENYNGKDFKEDGICYSGIMNCENCDGCQKDNYIFRLKKYEDMIGFDFYHKIKGLIINVSSELLKFNFCPWCGKQLSNNKINFDKCCLGMELDIED